LLLPVRHPFDRKEVLNAAVIVAALGYFVDIYDLVLFTILRVPSLTALGFSGQQLTEYGELLISRQMLGMLVGGILWGILGDKKGRLSVLFGSIFLYSLANIANGFVTSIEGYALWRFIAGVGLAGELGAGITLVSEVLPKESRGYGTMVVAGIGTSGALLASYLGKGFAWQTSYFIGGGLGLLLLILRVSVYESGMFNALKERTVERGNFFSLFSDRERFFRYLRCIMIGVPIWYIIGILVTFSPEFGKALGLSGPVSAADGIFFSYLGLSLGDFTSGWLSQAMHSRKKVVGLFLGALVLCVAIYFVMHGETPVLFYTLLTAAGFFAGYWAVFVTIAAEQFGTNMRATVATTVPNFVRGSLVLVIALFKYFRHHLGLLIGGALVGVIVLAIAVIALIGLKETFGKDLDYIEGTS
jgi:MFS transporter, putative metabolite:H+ symporter